MKIFATPGEFAAAAGAELGTTDWIEIDQTRIDGFAEATGDHQWIHVDPERAASGPFSKTIAHGLLTLSLLPIFQHELFRVGGVKLAVNCGFNRVRFITPVPVGSKLRASARILETVKVPGGVQGTVSTTIQMDGATRPAAVVESIVRYLV
jgi:acyl dehydratase